jgi:hypothetical protein
LISVTASNAITLIRANPKTSRTICWPLVTALTRRLNRLNYP